MMAVDENERLRNGTLPTDPFADAEPYEPAPESEPRKHARPRIRVVSSTETPPPPADEPENAPQEDEAPAPSVAARLHRKGDVPKKLVGNVLTILSCDPRIRELIAYDSFKEAPILLGQPPQRAQDAIAIAARSEWTPQDSTRTAAWLYDEYQLDVAAGMVTEAMLAIAQRHQVHPVRDYLDALEWDGKSRIDTFFPAYAGTEDSDYTRGVARILFLSAVARVRRPGCKVDTMPVLEGAQGALKSTLLRVLASDEWFADTPLALGDKDAYQGLRGIWIYEFAELASLKGHAATRIKSFTSSPSDHYRPSYEPRARSVPRQCIFVGTTNEAHYLADATGGRRTWPQRIVRVDIDAVRRDRDQLWAEASVRFAAGEPWWPSRELDTLGAIAQEERFESDPWEAPLAEWLGRPMRVRFDAQHQRHEEPLDASAGFTMSAVMHSALGVPVERQDKRGQERVAHILRRCGWVRGKAQREGAKIVRRWFAGVEQAGNGGGNDAGNT